MDRKPALNSQRPSRGESRANVTLQHGVPYKGLKKRAGWVVAKRGSKAQRGCRFPLSPAPCGQCVGSQIFLSCLQGLVSAVGGFLPAQVRGRVSRGAALGGGPRVVGFQGEHCVGRWLSSRGLGIMAAAEGESLSPFLENNVRMC